MSSRRSWSPLSLSVHPEFAALHDEVAAEAAAPVQPLSQAVVGSVPAAVLHDGQREPRKHPVLGVGARHRLVLRERERHENTEELQPFASKGRWRKGRYLQQSLLPVVQLGSRPSLVLQLHSLQDGTVKVSPRLLLEPTRAERSAATNTDS